MTAYTNNNNLIAAINHSNLNNGEVVIKLNGEIITGRIQNFGVNTSVGSHTTFEISGIILK